MSKESIEHAITVAEHMLLVLKRMKDDPQGDTGGLYKTAEEALHARWQAVISDLHSLVDAMNEELKLKGAKLIFDTEEFADMEVGGTIQ
ncbi:MAG: hypothetical protein WA197_06610 [Candidatus Acidiferrales bacterium]